MTWDNFFYYGLDDVFTENNNDFQQGLLTSPRSLYYFRQEGCGVDFYENYPNGLTLTVTLGYAIVNWCAFRNTYVSDGNNGKPDRRIVTSQNMVLAEGDGGNLDVKVSYINMMDYSKMNNLKLTTGAGNVR